MTEDAILVVDDEYQILNAMEDLLEDDYQVFTSTSPEQALEMVSNLQELAVIISDQRMPKMQGDEFLSKVKNCSDASRILLTGYADMDAVIHAVNDGQIFAYVSKPWDPEQLRFLIQRAAEFHNMSREVKEARTLLYNLMESQPDAVYFKDSDHRYLHLNRTELNFLTVDTIEEALGKTPDEAMPPFWARKRIALEKQVFTSGKPIIDKKTEKSDRQGRPHWYSTSMAPVLDENGQIYRLVGITREITKQRWVEKENQLVFDITRTVVDSQSTSGALGLTLQKICDTCGWSYGEAWLRDPSDNSLHLCPEWFAQKKLDVTALRYGTEAAAAVNHFGAVGEVWATGNPIRLKTKAAIDGEMEVRESLQPDLGFKAMLAVPIPDQDGRPIAIFAFFMQHIRGVDDAMVRLATNTAARLGSVFQRKETERALATSESRFRDVAEVASDWIWEFASDKTISYVSSRFEEIMGMPRSRVIGKRVKLLTSGNEGETGWKLLQTCLDGQLPFKNIEIVMVDAVGQSHNLSLSGKPIYDEAGQFKGFRGTTSDLTEQKKIQRALTESKSRFIEILDNASTAISVKDTQKNYTLVNHQFETLFNVKNEEVTGRTDYDVFEKSVADKIVARDNAVLRWGQADEFEIKIRLTHGNRVFLANAFPLYDIDKKADGICCIYTDITERKRLEEHLTQSSKMEAIGQLTGGVAHDFNNLLTVIMGNLELLQRTMDGDKQSKWLQTALRAATRGSDLTKRLLAFSRRQVLEPKVLNVNNNLREMEPMARRTIGENIAIRLDLEPDLWPVMIDEAQLESALLNLVVNARDAMPAGGTITLSTGNISVTESPPEDYNDLAPGDYVSLRVRDTGLGMSPELQSRALEPFFTTKERGKGTGLGLSMVYGFVMQSEGHFRIRSAEGEGCTIEMIFARAAEGWTADEHKIRHYPATALQGANIVVVDDDEDIRTMAVESLSEAGFTVHASETGPETLRLLKSLNEVHVLITDIVLPGSLSGIEIAHKARKLHPTIGILISSGYPEEEDHKWRDAPPPSAQWLKKPYMPSQLTSKVFELLSDIELYQSDDNAEEGK